LWQNKPDLRSDFTGFSDPADFATNWSLALPGFVSFRKEKDSEFD
jgi:hypothetical protein